MLLRPQQVHGVATPEHYRAFQADLLRRNRTAQPWANWPEPFASVDAPTVYVGAGKWLVRCVCGNCPSVDPDWRLACCAECGAIYEDLVMPADAEAIEAVLMLRAKPLHRNWRPPETVADLVAENLDAGEPVPEEAQP